MSRMTLLGALVPRLFYAKRGIHFSLEAHYILYAGGLNSSSGPERIPLEISLEMLRDLARMACLAVNEEELLQLGPQLQELLDHFSQLEEMPDDQPPDANGQPEPDGSRLREDQPLHGLEREIFLEGVPATEANFIRIPRVLEAPDREGGGDGA